MEERSVLLLASLLAFWAGGPPGLAQRRGAVTSDSSSSEERPTIPRPPVRKCPSDIRGRRMPCGRMCSSDDKCPGSELCCRYGCRRECLHPLEVNPGYCPLSNPVAATRCATNCTTDARCGKGKKCCRWGCFSTCVDAEPAHPGVCPERKALGRFATCQSTCREDRECLAHQKCCFTGCSLECTDIEKDVCELPKDPGSCTSALEYFYYNSTTTTCDAFAYSGCGGNSNRFYTKEDCVAVCGKPVKSGTCPECLGDSEECDLFCSADSDCPGEERCCRCGCSRTCVLPVEAHPGYCPKPSADSSEEMTICLANCTSDASCGEGKKCCHWGCHSNCATAVPPHPGLCPNRKIQPTTAHCTNSCTDDQGCPASQKCCPSGCGLQCMDAEKEMCRLPVEKGPCKAYTLMYHYSPRTKTCEVFIYGGCGGNSNRFSTLEECRWACKYPDTCRLPMDRGHCSNHTISYYYNHAKKTCESFTYHGCAGNDNRFRTLEQCRSTCLYPEVCKLPVDPGPCDDHVSMYYYNHLNKSCVRFRYGGCAGNLNRFHTLEECEQHCRHPEICMGPPETGPCCNYSCMYYYSPSEQTCLPFPYGGCKGNENRFPSVEECMDTCGVKDICRLPREEGPCLQNISRYYYNPANKTCERFIYGGCGGNENRFETQMECVWKCRNPAICRLPKQPGPCEAIMLRYYYNSATKTCEIFIYGGCEGNENRFESLSECEHACKKPAICRLPRNSGEGEASIPMYHYDPVGTVCELFTFKGRKGNQNRFATLVECQESCRDPDICKRTQDPGPCEAHSQRFYYNATTRLCSQFYYGNCPENPNNFPTKEGCQLTCEGPEKPGSCPPADPSNCLVTCQKDCECPGTKKCCSNGCGQVCKEPVTAKPGRCPPVPSSAVCSSSVETTCQHDSECPGNEKCCSSGCSHACRKPLP